MNTAYKAYAMVLMERLRKQIESREISQEFKLVYGKVEAKRRIEAKRSKSISVDRNILREVMSKREIR